jgi:hypothetical protein
MMKVTLRQLITEEMATNGETWEDVVQCFPPLGDWLDVEFHPARNDLGFGLLYTKKYIYYEEADDEDVYYNIWSMARDPETHAANFTAVTEQPVKQFLYCEDEGTGGMDHYILHLESGLAPYGWMEDSCKEADIKMMQWMETAEVGDYYQHRVGVCIRVKDKLLR